MVIYYFRSVPTASKKYVDLNDKVRTGCPKLGHTTQPLLNKFFGENIHLCGEGEQATQHQSNAEHGLQHGNHALPVESSS